MASSQSSTINQAYVNNLYERILQQDRLALAKAITLIESSNLDHQVFARSLIEKCLPHSGNSMRIGITGTPGVGKSTFIESLGMNYIENDHHLAVLTIDPTSPIHHGSILGDKSRMDRLSNNPKAYVRSSPSREVLGGTTDRTRETIILCEAAGYNVIFVETVGIGQSETEILNMVDYLVLLVLPGSGDEIQGIKRGIVEVADLIVVNKADRNTPSVVKETLNAYKFAVHLKKQKESKWTTEVLSCSSLTGEGLETVRENIDKYFNHVKSSEFFEHNRNRQHLIWFQKTIESELLLRIASLIKGHSKWEEVLDKVKSKKWSPYKATKHLLNDLIE